MVGCVAAETDVSNAEIMAELRALRAVIDGLLDDFGPVLAVFRPANGHGPNYLQAAGAARQLRRSRKTAARGDDG